MLFMVLGECSTSVSGIFQEYFRSVSGVFQEYFTSISRVSLCSLFLAESGENFLVFQKPETEKFWEGTPKKIFEKAKVV